MRIYEGSPRQDWEEVLRSVGAYLDDRGMRALVFLETDTGFIVQGTVVASESGSGWGESLGKLSRVTVTLQDDDVAAFMDQALAKRGHGPDPSQHHYEAQLRVIGKYLDDQHPKDIFFFELDGAYVIRLTMASQAGLKQSLVEFTPGDISELIANAPALRRGTPAKQAPA
jgi:hypothetical protein